jgi:hypothetical protein
LFLLISFTAPLLHRDFFRFLESRGSYDGRIEEETFDRILNLLSLLLNDSTSEFDFIVFSRRDHEDNRDEEMWQLLLEKCPNLERITDSRKLNFSQQFGFEFVTLTSVMHFLIDMPKLLHIDLDFYLCNEDDLILLVETFPSLKTLNVVFDHLSFDGMRHLFKLQELEVFRINLRYPLDVTMQEVSIYFSQQQIFKFFWRNLLK